MASERKLAVLGCLFLEKGSSSKSGDSLSGNSEPLASLSRGDLCRDTSDVMQTTAYIQNGGVYYD